jgi:2-dehydropantoate 2-reductase
MRVAVVGAGAMGSIFGAAFHDAGNDVSLVELNPATVEAVRQHGLHVERRDGRVDRYVIPITSDPAELGGPVDLAVFQVKGFATPSAAELVRPIVSADTIVLTLQNGMGNEGVLLGAFPGRPVLIGNSIHSSLVTAPGRVNHTGVRPTYIGPARAEWQPAADRVAAALEGSGFEVHALNEHDIHHQIWAKFVLNCGSLPTCALSGLSTEDFGKNEAMLRLCDELVRETCAIAAAAGFPLDVEDRVAMNRDLFRTAGGKASMLQDIEARRRTEIDTINGAALLHAELHGVPAPLNRAMVALVKGREAAFGIA